MFNNNVSQKYFLSRTKFDLILVFSRNFYINYFVYLLCIGLSKCCTFCFVYSTDDSGSFKFITLYFYALKITLVIIKNNNNVNQNVFIKEKSIFRNFPVGYSCLFVCVFVCEIKNVK